MEVARFVRLKIRDATRQRVGGTGGVLGKLAHAAEVVVEVLLSCLELLCRPSTSIPVSPDTVVSIVRFPFRLESSRGCNLQVPAHHVVHFTTVINF